MSRPASWVSRQRWLLVALAALASMVALWGLGGRWYFGTWLLFLVGALAVMKLPKRLALAMVLIGGAVLLGAGASSPPNSSDDMYRYVWDGRVQHAGIDPYRYPPLDPALQGLREPWLWNADAPWCSPSGCTLINRPSVPTIYPPVAQGVFYLVEALSPDGAREHPMQVAMSVFALLVAGFLWYALGSLGMDPRRSVLWAWCPLVIIETGNNAHADTVAALWAAIALWLVVKHRGRRWALLAGSILGLSIATKLTPALLGPAMIRRRGGWVIAGSGALVALVYLPHVIALGAEVLGYLPGYLRDEGFGTGARYALLSIVASGQALTLLAGSILVGVTLWVIFRGNPKRPWDGAALMVAAALLVTCPSYPWYGIMLAMIVALGARAEYLLIASAGYIPQFSTGLHLDGVAAQRLGYGVALAVVVGMSVARRARRPAPALRELVVAA